MKQIIKCLCLLAVLMMTACSTETTQNSWSAYRKKSATEIFREGEIALAHGHYGDAVSAFEALEILYPYGDYTEQAQLDLIYAYYQNEDPASAAAAAGRFIKLYPRSKYIDYAYYMKGVAEFDQDRGWLQKYLPINLASRDPGAAKESFNDFSTVLRNFPHSPYAADARQRMIYLKNLFARHELHVAQFYYRKGAYVASSNRANYILQHYQESAAIPGALIVLIESYQKLQLVQPAMNSLKVMQANYPNSEALPRLLQAQQELLNRKAQKG